MSIFGGHFSKKIEAGCALIATGIRDAHKLSMNKTSSLYVVAVTLLFAGIMARLRAMVEKQVPVGYQDENGFHLGPEPKKK
jgi:hypothetical protein